MLKIKKLNDDATLFRISQFAIMSDDQEKLVWEMRLDRKEFILWVKQAVKDGTIKRKEWFEHGKMYLKYSKVPVVFNDEGESVSGVLYGVNA